MNIGILKTGGPPESIGASILTYPQMIRTALGADLAYCEFDVTQEILPDAGAADGWVITGSACGVYDPDPWIGRLREWLRALDQSTPLLGICFGHQIIAEAYGGVVQRSELGWTGGLQSYRVFHRESWMDEALHVVLPVAHQDHVTVAPPNARVIAESEHCTYAAFSYQDRRAISFQGHPEFSKEYAATLIDYYRGKGVIGAEEAERGRISLQQSSDSERVCKWIRGFWLGRADF